MTLAANLALGIIHLRLPPLYVHHGTLVDYLVHRLHCAWVAFIVLIPVATPLLRLYRIPESMNSTVANEPPVPCVRVAHHGLIPSTGEVNACDNRE